MKNLVQLAIVVGLCSFQLLSAQLHISGSVQEPSCYHGTNGSIVISVTGGSAPYTYLWSNGETDSSVLQLQAGLHTVFVRDQAGAEASKSFIVNEPTVLKASLYINETNICHNEQTFASVSVTGGSGSYSYAWSDPKQQATPTAVGLIGGLYSVTVTDTKNCQTVNTFYIFQNDSLYIGEEKVFAPKCLNTTSGSIAIAPTGGNAPYSYRWSHGGYGDTVANLLGGDYSVTVTDDNGCQFKKTYTLPFPTETFLLKENEFAVQPISCHNASDGVIEATLSNFDGYSLKWSSNNGKSGSINNAKLSLLDLEPAYYSVTVTNPDKCEFITNFLLENPVDISIDSTSVHFSQVTESGRIKIHASGGNNICFYSIDGGMSFEKNNGLFENVPSGKYPIAVQDTNGCVKSGSMITLNSNEQPLDVFAVTESSEKILSVHPNPTKGDFTLQFRNTQQSNFMVTITNMRGEQVFNKDVRSNVI